MKIYLLRHEERFEPPAFYTSLTPTGLKNSVKLKDILNKEKIDVIYSSPFLRVLQTLMPYCLENNLQEKVNIEYSLYETMQDNCYLKDNHKIELKDTDKQFLLANPDYASFITVNTIKCPETNMDIKMRINMFIDNLIEVYKSSNLNILIASHAGVLGEIENCKYDKSIYPQGGVMLLYDNEYYCNKAINF